MSRTEVREQLPKVESAIPASTELNPETRIERTEPETSVRANIVQTARETWETRPGLRQFVKFCIVGLSSFAIDIGLLNLFHYRFGWPLLESKTLSFLVAVGNGFIWNRLWTFRAHAGDLKRQYPKFVLTNSIGLVLNLGIMTGAILLATKLGVIHANRPVGEILQLIVEGHGKSAFNPLTVNLATLVATVFVTAWNFTAAKFWTFKESPAAR